LGTYTGTISVGNTTGVVSISNAAPAGAHTITLVIRPATMPVMDSARGRFAKPVTVVFERSPVFER